MLEYKTQWYGFQGLVAPRLHPPTKTCSACGQVKADLPLSERVFRCAACGEVIDRDLNAARNLAAVAEGSPETLSARGVEVSPQGNGLVQPAAAQQESPSRNRAAAAAGKQNPMSRGTVDGG